MTTPYILTDRGITVYIDGEAFTVDRSVPVFQDVMDEMGGNASPDTLRHLLGGYSNTEVAFEDTTLYGSVTVTRSGVTYNGAPVSGALADRMVEIAKAGLPLDPWVNFLTNTMANPHEFAQNELYLWLANSDLPITDDGCFLAYKKLRSDYTDIHTGKMDNSPGNTVTMPRYEVDTNRYNTCSVGLHFCSREYLPAFGCGDGEKVVLVKVNPADVVSIPVDYNNAKGRTWKYEVVSEVTGLTEEEINGFPPVVHVEGTDIYTDFVWAGTSDWGQDDDYVEWEEEDWEPIHEDDMVPDPEPIRGYWKNLWSALKGGAE